MNILYTLIDSDQDTDALDYRFCDENVPLLGQRVWMNPENLDPGFEVTTLRLFQSAGQKAPTTVYLAELSKIGEPADYPRYDFQNSEDYCESIMLYCLGSRFYGCSFHWSERGHLDNMPELGPFHEYDLQSKGESPNKQVIEFETLYGTGVFPTRIHIVQLEPIRDRILIAA
jgi:hypothetical protein